MSDLITIQDLNAPEEGTYGVLVSFFERVGSVSTPVTPNSATWTLTNAEGVVINSRLAVAISPLTTTGVIVLENLDLEIGVYGTTRKLLVEALYNSTLGTNLKMKAQTVFYVEDFTAVT